MKRTVFAVACLITLIVPLAGASSASEVDCPGGGGTVRVEARQPHRLSERVAARARVANGCQHAMTVRVELVVRDEAGNWVTAASRVFAVDPGRSALLRTGAHASELCRQTAGSVAARSFVDVFSDGGGFVVHDQAGAAVECPDAGR